MKKIGLAKLEEALYLDGEYHSNGKIIKLLPSGFYSVEREGIVRKYDRLVDAWRSF